MNWAASRAADCRCALRLSLLLETPCCPRGRGCPMGHLSPFAPADDGLLDAHHEGCVHRDEFLSRPCAWDRVIRLEHVLALAQPVTGHVGPDSSPDLALHSPG